MRKNKGFTLIELLAIIVILGLIALAAIPNISKQVKESEKQEQTVLDKKIENASKLYAAKYYVDEIVGCNSEMCDIKFTLNDLENDGLLSLNDDQCSGNVTIEETSIKTVEADIEIKWDSGNNQIKFNYNNIAKDSTCYDN